MRRDGGAKGFTLVEVMIASAIAGILFAALAQMILTWAKASARIAIKQRTARVETDLRRLADAARLHFVTAGGYPSAGPWPAAIPVKGPLPWLRPAPGFDELGWAPEKSPTDLQYHVDGWATGFVVTAVGDLARNGAVEMYRLWGDVNMFEGPLPYQP